LRRAARIAERLKTSLEVVHVGTDRATGSTSVAAMREIRKVAEDVDGHWHEMTRDDPARALVEFAHAHQITLIVLGSSRRSRLEELTKGSVVTRVLRFGAEQGIDVHAIARSRRVAPEDEEDEE